MTAQITTVSDPAIDELFSQLRDKATSPHETRLLVSKLTIALAEKAIDHPSPGERIAVIVILRSGMAMQDAFLSQIPQQIQPVIYHLGLFRDRKTLRPVEYYNKLGPRPENLKHAYILDPIVATGGTAEAAISILRDWGVERVTFVSILASKLGLATVASAWPGGTRMVVAAVDPEVDSHGYVRPGLGDIGDRLYGTKLL